MTADQLLARLRTRDLGRHLEYRAEVTSTNDVALAAGGPHGLVVVAERQSRGRGRDGARWLAPTGQALLCSIVLVVDPASLPLPLLTFACAVSVCAAVRDLGVDRAHIKWPNDVLVDQRKLAGILCEARVRGAGPAAVVAGIGVNVGQTDSELEPGATSLSVETGVTHDRVRLLAAILDRLESEVDRLAGGDRAGLVARWEAMSSWHRGHRVRLSEEPVVDGTSVGIGPDGALLVLGDDGRERRILSGRVRFL